MNSDAMFARANAGFRKKRIGSIGAAVRSSQATKAASMTRPSESEMTISGLVQPWPLPRIRPQTMPKRPALASPRPGRSSLPPGPWLSCRRDSASGIRTMPIGTLSQKIHCHERPCDDRAAHDRAEGDRETADAAPGAEREPALLRGTAALRIVSVSGITIAPPRPCTARAMFRASIDGASAAATEPTVKMPTPIEKTRRRPKRSPSAAPVSSSTANVNV